MASQSKISKSQLPEAYKEHSKMAKVPYASIVGSMVYVMLHTHPNIIYAVGVLSQYMNKLGKVTNKPWNEYVIPEEHLQCKYILKHGDIELKGYMLM